MEGEIINMQFFLENPVCNNFLYDIR